MKTFADIQPGDYIFKYDEGARVPFERYNVIDKEKYQRVVNKFLEYDYTRIITQNPKNNEEVRLDISDYKINEWIYTQPGEVFISDLEEMIKHENNRQIELKEHFYKTIAESNRNIEYAEKFIKGDDIDFDSDSEIVIGDKIRYKDSGNEYTVLDVKDDGSLYIAKYFNGIRHLTVLPHEFDEIEKIF